MDGKRPTTPASRPSSRPGRNAGLGLATVWSAALAASLWAPDLVTGSEQSSFPIAALTAPLAALMSTPHVLRAAMADGADRPDQPRILVGSLSAIWAIAAIFAIAGPVVVTGSDPTRIPIAAIVAPVVALGVTRSLHDWAELLRQTAE